MKRQTTLRDIAKHIGLSAMTVSLALRDSPRISDATKERVRAAAREMHFEPNQLARALTTGRSNFVGVIVPNSSDLYYAEVIRAIEDAASALRYHVLLCNGSYRMETYTDRVRDMRRLHTKGLIAAPPFTSARPRLPAYWQELARADFEVVLINRQLDPPLFHQVAADYMAGVALVVDALADRGHRRIAYISGVPEVLPFLQRRDAFSRCMRARGLEVDERLVTAGELTPAGGYEAARRLWRATRRKPTAVVASSDTAAVGALRYLRDAGLDVPRDVSLASFDGTPVADYTYPSITTVATPMYDVGRQAFDLLLSAMAGHVTAPESRVLPVTLRLRESIGPAPR